MRNLFRNFSVFLIFVSLFFSVNCTEQDESVPFTAELADYSGCKGFGLLEGEVSSGKECVEYNYDGEKVLYLKHINAGFYCQPVEIWAEFELENNIIEIKEHHSGMADCYCLFDLEYEIENVRPRIYVINFQGPLSTLSFIVNLISHPQGSYCVDRPEYPWD